MIREKKMIDMHSQNEMIDIHCQNESTHGQMQVWVERNVRAQICRAMRIDFDLGGVQLQDTDYQKSHIMSLVFYICNLKRSIC